MKVVVVKTPEELGRLTWPGDCAAVLIGRIGDMPWREVAAAVSRMPGSADVPRFLLSPAHEHPDAGELTAAGIQSCLRYPFRPSDFYNLLSDDKRGPELVSTREKPLPWSRVLLVEDNPINQRVFARQLEMLGMDLLIRGDGHEGVAARRTEAVDLILMDCQLPTMDGFEATRRIRAWEEMTGAGRIPIIAVTAHVMAGDAEACYQAGMDDYLAKPFDLVKLRRKLSAWLPGADSSGEAGAAPEPRASPMVLDSVQLGECLTGDAEMDKDLISASMEEARARREEMAAALEPTDDDVWRASAHRGAGSCATLGFTGLAAAFRAAEHDSGDPGARRESLAMIDDLLTRTAGALAALGLADQELDLV